MEKKFWEKPELIVLTRSKPEEVVLGGCKGEVGTGPGTDLSNCVSGTLACLGCQNIVGS